MELNEFNKEYMNPLMEKNSNEDTIIYLMGDFNIDLMKIEEDNSKSNLFDNMTPNLFVPDIIYPTRITPTTKTLIDNIFSNSPNFEQGMSGNLTISISNHIAQLHLMHLIKNEWVSGSLSTVKETY